MPYALRARVEDELERLVELGVLEQVQFADWAAPIVLCMKSDKSSIRICGDFKITINCAIKLDQYPIPKIEDLFAKLSGGKMFTKLDLSQAYQQVRLDAASKKLVVINTRGLFRYYIIVCPLVVYHQHQNCFRCKFIIPCVSILGIADYTKFLPNLSTTLSPLYRWI